MTEHLEKLGYVPRDIDYCILTYLDIDHAGGVRLVKGTKRIMMSKAEIAAVGRADREQIWEEQDIGEKLQEKKDTIYKEGVSAMDCLCYYLSSHTTSFS